MPRKQVRGPVRNTKAGGGRLAPPAGAQALSDKEQRSLERLTKLGVEYLDRELRTLMASDGNFKEVTAIVKALEWIRASRSGEPPAPPPAPTPRDNGEFQVGFDD